MIQYLYKKDLDRFAEIVKEGAGYHLFVYATRGPEEVLKVHLCTEHEWYSFYEPSYYAEYMTSSIDIMIDMMIDKSTYYALKEPNTDIIRNVLDRILT